jgi:hypothetical protein
MRESFKMVTKPVARVARPSMRRLKKSRVGQSIYKMAPHGEDCTACKIMQYLVPIVILIASSIGLIIATGNASKITPNSLSNIVPSFNNEDVTDPFSGTDIPKWKNDGNGLELELLNALDDTWQSTFALAIADWDFGNPDALTLGTEKITYEFDCEAVPGKVKVCNGDYGETQWRGINQALLDGDGFIEASSAKMNEFYLKFAGEGTRQYTMCHEIGHSFGVPHTDENFDNADLGNCLDYTNNFDENKHPDETNYEFLTELYGLAARRQRRAVRRDSSLVSRVKEIPQHVREKMRDVVGKLERRMDKNAHEDGWKLLHRTEHGEEHEMELQDGYKVRVHMLLVQK